MEEFKTSFKFDAEDNVPVPQPQRQKINRRALGTFLIVALIVTLPTMLTIYGLVAFVMPVLPDVAFLLFTAVVGLITFLSTLGIIFGIPTRNTFFNKREPVDK